MPTPDYLYQLYNYTGLCTQRTGDTRLHEDNSEFLFTVHTAGRNRAAVGDAVTRAVRTASDETPVLIVFEQMSEAVMESFCKGHS